MRCLGRKPPIKPVMTPNERDAACCESPRLCKGTSNLIPPDDFQAELNEGPPLRRAVQPRGIDRVEGKAFVRPFRKQLDQPAAAQKLFAADFEDLADAGTGLARANQRSLVRHQEPRLDP